MMTIDSVDIFDYGFFLSGVGGLYNNPARKKILKDTAVEAKDIEFDDDTVTVTLVGLFETYSALKTGVDTLLGVIGVERSYSFSDYSKLIRGVVNGGVKVDVDMLKVKIVFTIKG